MRRPVLFVLSLFALLHAAPAQAQAVDAAVEMKVVRDVVIKLFDGMRARDTLVMKSTLAPVVQMYGVSRDGEITATGPEGWLRSIGGSPSGPVLDEVLHDIEVRVDGHLATVWTYYDLFAGDRFVHCGYDAIQLIKAKGEWKIVAIGDTRRTTDCRMKRAGT